MSTAGNIFGSGGSSIIDLVNQVRAAGGGGARPAGVPSNVQGQPAIVTPSFSPGGGTAVNQAGGTPADQSGASGFMELTNDQFADLQERLANDPDDIEDAEGLAMLKQNVADFLAEQESEGGEEEEEEEGDREVGANKENPIDAALEWILGGLKTGSIQWELEGTTFRLPTGVIPIRGEPADQDSDDDGGGGGGGGGGDVDGGSQAADDTDAAGASADTSSGSGTPGGDAPTADEQALIDQIQADLGLPTDDPVNQNATEVLVGQLEEAIAQETDADTLADLEEFKTEIENAGADPVNQENEEQPGEGTEGEDELGLLDLIGNGSFSDDDDDDSGPVEFPDATGETDDSVDSGVLDADAVATADNPFEINLDELGLETEDNQDGDGAGDGDDGDGDLDGDGDSDGDDGSGDAGAGDNGDGDGDGDSGDGDDGSGDGDDGAGDGDDGSGDGAGGDGDGTPSGGGSDLPGLEVVEVNPILLEASPPLQPQTNWLGFSKGSVEDEHLMNRWLYRT